MDAETVALSRTKPGHVAVPAERRPLGQSHGGLRAVVIEQTEIDALCDFREDREVDAGAVEMRAERKGSAGPDCRRHYASVRIGSARNSHAQFPCSVQSPSGDNGATPVPP